MKLLRRLLLPTTLQEVLSSLAAFGFDLFLAHIALDLQHRQHVRVMTHLLAEPAHERRRDVGGELLADQLRCLGDLLVGSGWELVVVSQGGQPVHLLLVAVDVAAKYTVFLRRVQVRTLLVNVNLQIPEVLELLVLLLLVFEVFESAQQVVAQVERFKIVQVDWVLQARR